VTGLSRKSIIASPRTLTCGPRYSLKDEAGKTYAFPTRRMRLCYFLPWARTIARVRKVIE